ncbi:hypothetical protein V6N13_001612 [Hibiscus sabdariffa]
MRCKAMKLVMVDAIKETLENDEQKVGADIVKRALGYPMKLIAKNAGVNGSVVIEKVLSNEYPKYGYNAATGKYEDLMASGIIDPTKVVRCCLEHATSVARTFLTSDAVVVDIKKLEPLPAAGNTMDNSVFYETFEESAKSSKEAVRIESDVARETDEARYISADFSLPKGGKDLGDDDFKSWCEPFPERTVGDEGEIAEVIPLNIMLSGKTRPNVVSRHYLTLKRQLAKARSWLATLPPWSRCIIQGEGANPPMNVEEIGQREPKVPAGFGPWQRLGMEVVFLKGMKRELSSMGVLEGKDAPVEKMGKTTGGVSTTKGNSIIPKLSKGLLKVVVKDKELANANERVTSIAKEIEALRQHLVDVHNGWKRAKTQVVDANGEYVATQADAHR